MKRLLWGLLILPLLGLTPVFNDYSDKEQIGIEFKNVYDGAQSRQFTVWKTTPGLSELRDGEMVIYSSGTVFLMLRDNQDLYQVQVSCITIKR